MIKIFENAILFHRPICYNGFVVPNWCGQAGIRREPDKLDVKRYGVIVTKGRKRGLLLSDLDGIDTVEEQIAVARRKAGIGEEGDITLERFEVIRHF